MSFSRIDVVADAGDLPAEQVRTAITRPLEARFQTLPSVTSVQSDSGQGSSELLVSFDPKTDPRVDLQYVNQAVAETRATIPAARDIVAAVIDPNREPVLSYALTSETLSPALLRTIALSTLAPELYGTRGMGRLLIVGGPATEYHVALDPAVLAATGIGAAGVTKAIADANVVQSAGETQRNYQRYAILVDSSLHDVASLGAVTVPAKSGSIPLRNLGSVTLGVSPPTSQTSLDGQHAVLLSAFALPGADTVKMAAEFKTRLRDAARHLPADVHVRLFWDQTTLIVQSQAALRDAILLGALLAILVIYIFLRSIRLTIVAATVIPLAMAIAIFALQQAGLSLNLMSVGGLAVAVGLIIDDAIVVIENIDRNARELTGASPDEVIAVAMSQLAGAMTTSTATTVVVFVPLALLTGVTGFFFRALAFTLAASLVVSLGLALFLAPIIARSLMVREGRNAAEKVAPSDALPARYEPVLRRALGHRRTVFAGSGAVLVLTVLLLLQLPTDFLPAMDEGQFEIGYTLPAGTTLAASDMAATAMERVVVADPAVADVGRLTGIDSNGVSPTQPNDGLLRVRLKPRSQRASYDVVSDRLRDALSDAVPASAFDFHQILEDMINDLSGAPAPVEITVRGPEQTQLIALANQLAKKIANVHGIVDASNGVVYDSPSLHIIPRGSALAALGITGGDIGTALAASTQGTVATDVAGTQNLIPVRVSVNGAQISASGDTPLLANGTSTALADVAAIETHRLQSDISAINSQTVVRVTANISGASLSSVTASLRDLLAAMPMPPGYSADIGGQALSQAQSFGEFISVIAIAIALVFAVMLAAFRSYRLPLVILTAIPLALIGLAVSLFVTGTAFNVSSFMGLLLLVGVVVKNGVLLVDVANKRVRAGDNVEDALIAAGKTRLRPIVMTTLAAIGGLFPLALGIGQGAEMERPLAIAVIGGLSTATIFTLLVIPVLYAAFVGDNPPASISPRRSAT